MLDSLFRGLWCLDGARYVYRTVKDIRFPLSVRNERAAMQRLLALVKETISGYPTTLEEDKEQLKVGKEYDCNVFQHGRIVTVSSSRLRKPPLSPLPSSGGGNPSLCFISKPPYRR